MTQQMFARTFGQTSCTVITGLWSAANLTEQQILDFDDEKEAAYREIVKRSFPELAGAKELIQSLFEAGVPMAIGSSGPIPNVEAALDHVDPHHHVAVKVTREDIERGKPDPQVFQIAAARLGIPSASCVVLEDAPVGVAAAHAAGSPCVGVMSTGRTREDVQEAEWIVNDLTEVDVDGLRHLAQ